MAAFLDTNVLGCLLDGGRKEKIARRLTGEQPHISVQVLNEFVAICKKCGKDRETAYQLADAIVVPAKFKLARWIDDDRAR